MSIVGKSVQKYSGFDPRLVGNCIGWFDAADSNSFVLSGSNIITWSNKVPNVFVGQIGNLTSNSGSVSPTLVGDGVVFNGTTQFLRASSWNAVPPGPFGVAGSAASGESIFFVGTFTGTTANFYTIVGPSATSGGSGNGPRAFQVQQLGSPASNVIRWNRYGTSIAGAPTPGILSNVRFLAAGINDSSTSTAAGYTALNGTRSAVTTQCAYAYVPIPTSLVGAANLAAPQNYYRGTMNEIIVYNWINSNDQKRVEGYLAWKWGLVGSLAAGHPYALAMPLTYLFNPTTLPGCSLWLDGADQSSMTLSGTNVTVWNDKSGNGRHASNGTSPTVSSTGVVFNGTNQYLTTPYTSFLTVSGETIFVVATPTPSTAGRFYSVLGPSVSNATNGRTLSYYLISGTTSVNLAIGGSSTTWITSNVTANARGLVTGIFTANSYQGFLGTNGNSTYAASATQTAYGAGTGTTFVGAGFVTGTLSSWFQGTIHEIIVYNRSAAVPNSANTSFLSTYETRRVESYLAAKWGLNAVMSSNHYSKLTPTPGVIGYT